MRRLALALCLVSSAGSAAGAQTTYRTPPQVVIDILDAPPAQLTGKVRLQPRTRLRPEPRLLGRVAKIHGLTLTPPPRRSCWSHRASCRYGRDEAIRARA